MSHVDDGQLNALLDGELTREEARAVEAHVASCADCLRRLNEARAFLVEAGELLGVLAPQGVVSPAASAPPVADTPLVAPVAQGPAPANPPTPAERASGPKVPKTAKEVAISVDGRTEKTPAIAPIFPHEVPQAPKPRRQWPDLEKLAWAASLILAIGVGYLGNEVYHIRSTSQVGTAAANEGTAADRVAAPQPAAEPNAAPAAQPAGRQLSTRTGTGADRRSVTGPASGGAGAGARSEVASNVGALGDRTDDGTKPRTSKPPPAAAQHRPEEIAQNRPLDAQERENATVGAPLAAAAPAPAPAQRAARQPAAPTAGFTAPTTTAPAAAGARDEGRVSSLEEASVDATSPSLARARTAAPAFRRVPMDSAVRRLSGSIRLMDGMNPARVDVGPGTLVPGADPERDVVRVTYGSGTEKLMLDQQLGAPQSASFNGLMSGDTLVSTNAGGFTQVRWVDRKFWMSLTGRAPADSVRALLERVR